MKDKIEKETEDNARRNNKEEKGRDLSYRLSHSVHAVEISSWISIVYSSLSAAVCRGHCLVVHFQDRLIEKR